MKINHLEIQGYKCFGPGVTTWELDGYSHVIVGPANAGKSSLVNSIGVSVSGGVPSQDFHGIAAPATMQLSVSFSLDASEAESVAKALFYVEGADRELSESQWISFSQVCFSSITFSSFLSLREDGSSVSSNTLLASDLWQIENNNTLQVTPGVRGSSVDAQRILMWFAELDGDVAHLRERLKIKLDSEHIAEIAIRTNGDRFLRDLVQSKVRQFTEVRNRTEQSSDDTVETWNGNGLAGVLGVLFGGKPQQKQQYAQIKALFKTLHPSMDLDLVRVGNKWSLAFGIAGINESIPSSNVGMGTLESLLLITNLMTSEDRVIMLEEPELHLHPQAQRAMSNVLLNASKKNQLLLVTHSRDIAVESDEFRLVRLTGESVPEKIVGRGTDGLSEIQPAWLREYLRDALFSRLTILVEGPYDMLTIENLLTLQFPNWRGAGVTVVPVDGKQNIQRPYQFLSGLQVDTLVLLDDDALAKTTNTWKQTSPQGPISAALYQAALLDLISQDDLDFIISVGQKVGAVKPYPKKFTSNWRTQLKSKGWFVLTSELDHLIIESVGESLPAVREVAKFAEEISRTIPLDSIPQQIKEFISMVKEKAHYQETT